MSIVIDITERCGVNVVPSFHIHNLRWRKPTSAVTRENLDGVSSPILGDDIGFAILIHIQQPYLRFVETEGSIGDKPCTCCGNKAPAFASKEHVDKFIRHISSCLDAIKNAVNI